MHSKEHLTTNRINWIQDKKLLSILSEVNDIEILTLTLFALDGQERKSFLKKHKEALLPPDDVDRITIYETSKPTLNRLGLLRTTEAAGQDGNIEERDPVTAKLLPFQYELTPFGALLLKRIDIITSSEGADYTFRK